MGICAGICLGIRTPRRAPAETPGTSVSMQTEQAAQPPCPVAGHPWLCHRAGPTPGDGSDAGDRRGPFPGEGQAHVRLVLHPTVETNVLL